MNAATRERLFDLRQAFDDPATVWLVAMLAGALVLSPLVILGFQWAGRVSPAIRTELWQRYRSWLVLVPAMVVPILLGAACTILAIAMLSVAAYREFARVTGLAAESLVYRAVYLAIGVQFFAVVDHWYGLFAAAIPLSIGTIAAVAIFEDRPAGYLKRVALAVLGYALFGAGLAHLAYLANDDDYRARMILLLAAVELNDVFAFSSGKLIGRFTPKLAPHTSPNKTLGGALGACLLTTGLFMAAGPLVFSGSPLASWGWLLAMGMTVSLLGQLGDLMLSSIKRDIGVKDMGQTIPGHGGLLDRFDSLLLVSPAVFHLIHYIEGVGLDQPARILL